MSPTRWAKTLQRRFMVSWREQPTRYDIEALQANIERVGLVIRVRWALVLALTVYSVVAGWAYTFEIEIAELVRNMTIPAVALAFVLAYNLFYQRTYRRLGNIAVLNHAQLLMDAVVVTVLVYYSGGVHSWFWAMYSLFILEAAFILPKRWHTWAIAGFCLAAVGSVIWGVYFGLLPAVGMPFVNPTLHSNLTYVAVRYLWEVTVLCGTATVATLMTGALRRREAQLAASSVVDDKTGLYDRPYFLRMLKSEIARAERDDRTLLVVLADIDDFDRFNKRFGIDRGDRLLRVLGRAMLEFVSERGSANVACRWGGEEFALIVSQSAEGMSCTADQARRIAEEFGSLIASVRLEDTGVTASVGVACYPTDGRTADELLDAADSALQAAAKAGGNRAVVAGDIA